MRMLYGLGIGFGLTFAGLVLLFGKYPYMIRGTSINFGWLLLTFGIVRLGWAVWQWKKRK